VGVVGRRTFGSGNGSSTGRVESGVSRSSGVGAATVLASVMSRASAESFAALSSRAPSLHEARMSTAVARYGAGLRRMRATEFRLGWLIGVRVEFHPTIAVTHPFYAPFERSMAT
jgi:hypothetical protein